MVPNVQTVSSSLTIGEFASTIPARTRMAMSTEARYERTDADPDGSGDDRDGGAGADWPARRARRGSQRTQVCGQRFQPEESGDLARLSPGLETRHEGGLDPGAESHLRLVQDRRERRCRKRRHAYR